MKAVAALKRLVQRVRLQTVGGHSRSVSPRENEKGGHSTNSLFRLLVEWLGEFVENDQQNVL